MAHQIEDVDIEPEEEYDEKADEDFNPEAADADEEVSSSSEDEEAPVGAKSKQTKKSPVKKRKSEAVDELDSGDEATIQEQRKKRKKRRKGDTAQGEDEDSGGDGGLIKTRAQRLAEKTERKHRKRARDGEVTIDVDGVWAKLKSLPVGRPADDAPYSKVDDGGEAMDVDDEQNKENVDSTAVPPAEDDEMITIKRRIEYAGQVTEVEERVPRSSKEAQRYLTSHASADPNHKPDITTSSALRRPLKRPSLFEPNPTALVKGVPPDKLRPRAPSRLDVLMAEKRAEEEEKKKAEKMTTVQKSALDWRGYVAGEQGLREELDLYGKSKSTFLEREEFLGRVEMAKEGRGREARMRG